MPKKPHPQLQLKSTKSGACSLDDSLNPQRQLSIMTFMNARTRTRARKRPLAQTTTTTTPEKESCGTTSKNDDPLIFTPVKRTTTTTTTTPQDALCRPLLMDIVAAVTPPPPPVVAKKKSKEEEEEKTRKEEEETSQPITTITTTTTAAITTAITTTITTPNKKQPTTITTPTTTTPTTTANKKKPLAQMFLDFGQANFGKQSVCGICGMLTVHGVEEDRVQHEQVCVQYKRGVELQIRNLKQQRCMSSASPSTMASGVAGSARTAARIVSRISSTTWIVEIRPTDSSAWQQKLQQCLSICNHELGFAMSSSTTSTCNGNGSGGNLKKTARKTAFLYLSHNRVVGLVTAEPVTCGYWMETASERSLIPQKALVGIYQLWTLQGNRGQGIATQLVDAARSKLVFGMQVPKSQVAFSSPTLAGLAFAKNYAPNQPPLVYEYYQQQQQQQQQQQYSNNAMQCNGRGE
jgi:N-acetyltransferase